MALNEDKQTRKIKRIKKKEIKTKKVNVKKEI